MQSTTNPSTSWLDRPIHSSIRISWETLLLSALLLLAVITRFSMLDARVMSHDETIHVYHNSWSLYSGQGYRHDPLSHGPIQFHLVALSYFLFGANDMTARIPAALFSIASVAFIWFYRRYLGKAGMFIAMAMMLISPILLFYGRYVREDIYAAFSGVVMLWGMLRYLETGLDKYTFWVGMPLVLHFTDKETAFIYAAQALLFIGLYFIFQVGKREWVDSSKRIPFMASLLAGLGLFGAAGLFFLSQRRAAALSVTQTAAPAIPGQALESLPVHRLSPLAMSLLILGVVALLIAIFFLIRGFSWKRLRQERSFGLLVLIGTLVMPMLSAFPVYFLGWNMPTKSTC
jgi:uncharacterized protein (TIGR03663 family)